LAGKGNKGGWGFFAFCFIFGLEEKRREGGGGVGIFGASF